MGVGYAVAEEAVAEVQGGNIFIFYVESAGILSKSGSLHAILTVLFLNVYSAALLQHMGQVERVAIWRLASKIATSLSRATGLCDGSWRTFACRLVPGVGHIGRRRWSPRQCSEA